MKKTFANENVLVNYEFPAGIAMMEENVKRIPPGTYELEEIPNPYWFGEGSWYVLAGTTFGAAVNSWSD